jgi:UDP:flavonoid glycosyltransferase YjiC (YdhE family)
MSYLPGLAVSMLPGIREALDDFRPDVVVTELGCYAGALAARERGLPWLVVTSTVVLYNETYSRVPTVGNWIHRTVAEAQRGAGMEPLSWPLRSPWANIVTGPPQLCGPAASVLPTDHLVGAVVEHLSTELPADLARFLGGSGPSFAVSLGTVAPGREGRWVDALVRELAVLGGPVVVSSTATPRDLPTNVLWRPWLPVSMASLMPHVDALVCHAGLNSVTEALWHGRPMLLRPLAYDHHPIARALDVAGAAIQITPGRDAGEAARAILGAEYRRRATEIRDELRSMGGTSAAADLVLEAGGVC